MTASSLFASDGDRQGIASSMVEEKQSDPQVPTTTSLYRKHRPNSFDAVELVGQEHVVRTLRNAISLGRIAHAYLFSGPRGTGKTTTARLLAKAINCLAPDPDDRPCNACTHCLAINRGASPDIIEIDAASNRGIDDIRDLREKSRYAPAQLPSKVYIIDEAHQITGAAANAFLKTLEEPPAHTRFILATTDPEELLPTIVSRCQRFEFRRIGLDDMVRRLQTVAHIEGIDVSDEALHLIARNATGSLRDALGLLEQLAVRSAASSETVSAAQTIAADDVRRALGLSRTDRVEAMAEALANRRGGDALRLVQDAIDEGEDPRQLNRQLVAFLRMLLLARAGGNSDADERAVALAEQFTPLELAKLAQRFSEIDFSIKHSPFPQLPLEVALVEATAAPAPQTSREEATSNHAAPENKASPPARVSLRDRVRNPEAQRGLSPTAPESPARQQPAPITPIRPVPPPTPVARSADESSDIDVALIAELWPGVRADVKALNRRIEALLSEVDPVAISGNLITLAVPYPFHRDKLNSDDVRETVAGVLSRRLSRNVSITCILRGETPSMVTQPITPVAPTVDAAADSEEAALDAARLRAAKNIFDAEEVDPTALGIVLEESAGN